MTSLRLWTAALAACALALPASAHARVDADFDLTIRLQTAKAEEVIPNDCEQVGFVSTVDPTIATLEFLDFEECGSGRTAFKLESDGTITYLGYAQYRAVCAFEAVDDDTARDLRLCEEDLGCERISATASQRRAMKAAYSKSLRARGPIGKVLFGRCGRRSYAVAKFSLAQVGVTNQPVLLRRVGSGRWTVRGESAGDPKCQWAVAGNVPWAMLGEWALPWRSCAGVDRF